MVKIVNEFWDFFLAPSLGPNFPNKNLETKIHKRFDTKSPDNILNVTESDFLKVFRLSPSETALYRLFKANSPNV